MRTESHKMVHVAVGVIRHQNKILISKRLIGAHQGGLWEFPGGKVEARETTQQALSRELHEELGIIVGRISPLLCVKHAYTDKIVGLDVWLVELFDGEPEGREGQLWRWVDIKKLRNFKFPKANQYILEFILQNFDP